MDCVDTSLELTQRVHQIVLEMALKKPGELPLEEGLLLRESLGFDSLTVAELMFRIQEELHLDIQGLRTTMSRSKTVGDLVGAVLLLKGL